MRRTCIAISLLFVFTVAAGADTLTLPRDKRPKWLAEEGLVMAGSWEPLPFRVRRDGSPGYTPTAEQTVAYENEHGEEMIRRLKNLGVNFVMMHCYKGGGLEMERRSMADAVRFSKRFHDAGMHVGVYAYSGAFLHEPFFLDTMKANYKSLVEPHGRRCKHETFKADCSSVGFLVFGFVRHNSVVG